MCTCITHMNVHMHHPYECAHAYTICLFNLCILYTFNSSTRSISGDCVLEMVSPLNGACLCMFVHVCILYTCYTQKWCMFVQVCMLCTSQMIYNAYNPFTHTHNLFTQDIYTGHNLGLCPRRCALACVFTYYTKRDV